MRDQGKGSSWTEEIAAIEQDIARLTEEKTHCEQKIKELRMKEDPGQGIFFHEQLFSLQQKKLSLEVELELRRKKKNRILLANGQLELL